MSEYTPTVWETGDLITAEKLNKIEDGIANASAVTVEALSVTENGTYSEEGKAYSPVTVNVDSDYTTAEVTIINNIGDDIPAYVYIPYISQNELQIVREFPSGTTVATCLLYKGTTYVYPDGYENVTVSGNATIGEGIKITGNCTITIPNQM